MNGGAQQAVWGVYSTERSRCEAFRDTTWCMATCAIDIGQPRQGPARRRDHHAVQRVEQHGQLVGVPGGYPAGPALSFTAAPWVAFTAGVRAGKFRLRG